MNHTLLEHKRGRVLVECRKNMTAGDGGIALTNDEAVADAMGCATNAGRSRFNRASEGMR